MISVIVATYNRARVLRRLLASLRLAGECESEEWEIIVVDNNSSDDTGQVLAETVAAESLPLRMVRERRQGKSYAVNAGIIRARGDILAFTDDDAIVAPSWLKNLRLAAASHPDAIGFGGRVVARWDVEPPRWLTGGRPLARVNGGVLAYDLGDEVFILRQGIPPPVGANFCFRRGAFERYGLFREDLGPQAGRQLYGEDTEFVYRLLGHGERLLYVPDVMVAHPVETDRLARWACLTWNFRVGRSAARMAGRLAGARSAVGVPLFVVRLLLTDAAAFVRQSTRGDAASRFLALQEVVYRLGMIHEFARLPWDFDPSRFVPMLASSTVREAR